MASGRFEETQVCKFAISEAGTTTADSVYLQLSSFLQDERIIQNEKKVSNVLSIIIV